MPVAHISAQQIGSLNMLSQQLAAQNQLGNALQQSQASPNIQMQMMQMDAGRQLAMSQFNALANVATLPTRTIHDPYFMRRAESYAEQGDKLIERMAFWSAFGLLAAPIMSSLADKLERVTDEVDSFVGMAA